MKRLRFLYLLAPLAAMVLVLGVACGDDDDEGDGGTPAPGGDELTLEEYFTELEALAAQFDEDRIALEDKYPAAFDSVDATRSLFEEGAPLLAALNEDLEAITPPSEAEDVHAAMITSTNESATFLENTAVALEDADDDDLPTLVDNSESLTQTLTRLQDACLDEQALADRENIDVDLKCPEEDVNPS